MSDPMSPIRQEMLSHFAIAAALTAQATHGLSDDEIAELARNLWHALQEAYRDVSVSDLHRLRVQIVRRARADLEREMRRVVAERYAWGASAPGRREQARAAHGWRYRLGHGLGYAAGITVGTVVGVAKQVKQQAARVELRSPVRLRRS